MTSSLINIKFFYGSLIITYVLLL